MSAPPLDLNAIDHPIVKSAIEAMNGRDKTQWYKLFSDNPAFGNPHDFTQWSTYLGESIAVEFIISLANLI